MVNGDYLVNGNLFTHAPPKRSQELIEICTCIPDRVLVFDEWGKLEYPKNNLLGQGDNQQQTQPTHDAGSRNQTRATLVGGELHMSFSFGQNKVAVLSPVLVSNPGCPGYKSILNKHPLCL